MRQPHHRTIFGRIFLGLVAIGVSIVAVSGVMFYSVARDILSSSLKDEIVHKAELGGEYFKYVYNAPISESIALISSSPALRDFQLCNFEEKLFYRTNLERLLLAVTRNKTQVKSIRFVDEAGDEQAIIIGDKRSRNYRGFGEQRSDLSSEFRKMAFDLFEQLRGGTAGDWVAGEPYRDNIQGIGFLVGSYIAEPNTGSFGGAILIHYSLEPLIREMAMTKVHSVSATWVKDMSGKNLLAPLNLYDSKNSASGNASELYYQSSTLCLLGSDPDPLLLIKVGLPIAIVQEQLRPLIWRLIAISVLLICIMLPCAMYVSNKICGPIKVLSEASEALGQGDMSVRIDDKLEYSSELSKMAASFNAMAESLEDSQREILLAHNLSERIIATIPSGLAAVDSLGRVVQSNHTLNTLLGQQSLVGCKIHLFFDDASLDQAIYTALNEHCNTENLRVIAYCPGAGSEKRTLEVSVVTLFDENENDLVRVEALEGSAKALIVFDDITVQEIAAKKLEDMNKEMIISARQAGMAEVATGVLHNVGNIMNSIQTSVTLLFRKTEKKKRLSLDLLIERLSGFRNDIREAFDDQAFREHFLYYLETFNTRLESEYNYLEKEMKDLKLFSNNAVSVIQIQQNNAGLGLKKERVDINQLVDEAIHIEKAEIGAHNILLERDYAELPKAWIKKNLFMVVVVNLVGNAVQAMRTQRSDRRMLSVRSRFNGKNRISIEVRDNGVGISKENLRNMFSYGFTTKKDGHGFGLHSSYQAAKDLDGELSVHSEGEGLGTTFKLEFSIDVEAN